MVPRAPPGLVGVSVMETLFAGPVPSLVTVIVNMQSKTDTCPSLLLVVQLSGADFTIVRCGVPGSPGSHLFVTALNRRSVGQQFCPGKPVAGLEPPSCTPEPSLHTHWPPFFTIVVGSEGSHCCTVGWHVCVARLHCQPDGQHCAGDWSHCAIFTHE